VRRYLVIYERGEHSWGAYALDVPGCVAVGETREEVEALFREALALHLEALREDGQPIPEPTTEAGQVEVAA
jgi:predicted RNase H-like HicB family nuclease